MQRDYKGTYLRGQRGDSSTVPGIQDPYEAPLNPEVRVDTTQLLATDAARAVVEVVKEKFKEESTHRPQFS